MTALDNTIDSMVNADVLKVPCEVKPLHFSDEVSLWSEAD